MTILRASATHAAATTALVDAMAGMMRLTTPSVSAYVTPAMPKAAARSAAARAIQPMSSGESVSNLRVGAWRSHNTVIA